MPLEKLDRARLVEALNLLGGYAAQENIQLEVCIYGGSAMLLAYDSRESTKDLDAIIRPSEVGKRLGERVAKELKLSEEWLNDNVKNFISDQGTFAPLAIDELETTAKRHLKIVRPSASYLLAMKCLACRSPLPGYSGDIEDIGFLINKMGIRSLEEIEQHMERFYPTEALTARARSLIEPLLPRGR